MKNIVITAIMALVCLSVGAQTQVSSPSGTINGHEYVNLGLSVKWATCNLGAFSPSDYGYYYAWGEIRTKTEYTKENSVTYKKAIGDIAGDPQFDAAKANWGGTWMLPTREEIDELVEKCTWRWVKENGHNGYMVIGPNGNSIFLPANGFRRDATFDGLGAYGLYWSSETTEEEFNTPEHVTYHCTYMLYFTKEEFLVFSDAGLTRYIGYGIRPVSK